MLEKLSVKELKDMARANKVRGFSRMTRDELVSALTKQDLPKCYRVTFGGELLGYCDPKHWPGIATTLYYLKSVEQAVKKGSWSDRQRMKQILETPIPGSIVKDPPR